MKRVFLVVLDSCGIGALPDAATFGDAGTHTLRSCYETGNLQIPNLLRLGMGNIEGVDFFGKNSAPIGAFGRCREASQGKDTTIGHWEIAGIISPKPMPTYPEGFPVEVIEAFSKATGRGVLCNEPYSGTEVIKEYGKQHIESGDLIVYTSADSVFQIAAHEEVVPVETLYEYCRIARKILAGEHAVGRVIARPFLGEEGEFVRTANRHDFSLEPYGTTMLDVIKQAGKDVIAIGKITDIFAGRGVTETILTHNNNEGMCRTDEVCEREFTGLCFVNLVDFDMIYGHRNNAEGYTQALNEFDKWLGNFLPKLGKEDMLVITADHGCDPGDISTDHTREYTPLLVYGQQVEARELGTRESFADIAATICKELEVGEDDKSVDFLGERSKTAGICSLF